MTIFTTPILDRLNPIVRVRLRVASKLYVNDTKREVQLGAWCYVFSFPFHITKRFKQNKCLVTPQYRGRQFPCYDVKLSTWDCKPSRTDYGCIESDTTNPDSRLNEPLQVQGRKCVGLGLKRYVNYRVP